MPQSSCSKIILITFSYFLKLCGTARQCTALYRPTTELYDINNNDINDNDNRCNVVLLVQGHWKWFTIDMVNLNEMELQRVEMKIVGCVALSYKTEFQVKGWERWHNLGTTAKQLRWYGHVLQKRRQWFGEEMYGAWSGGCQAKRYTKENLEIECGKRLRHVNWTERMPWIIIDGGYR